MSFDEPLIAGAALDGLTFLATVVLFIFTVRNVHVHQDAARQVFSWLKAAIAVYALACAFSAISTSLLASAISDRYSRIDYRAYIAFDILAPMSKRFTDALVLMVLVRAADGIILAHGGQADKAGKGFRVFSYVFVAIIIALTFVAFSFTLAQMYVAYFIYNNPLASYWLALASETVVLVAALGTLAQSSRIMFRCHSEPRVAKLARFLLSGSLLWLTRAIYKFIVLATDRHVLGRDYLEITNYVFAFLPIFILLCVFYALGVKKENGLRSRSHPVAKVVAGNGQALSHSSHLSAASIGPETTITDSRMAEEARRNMQAHTQIQLHMPH